MLSNNKSIAIMQPYFMPYIGYFQLINAVDEFVIYDNIEYTKKGWINRNRILVNGMDVFISVPLKKDSDNLPIKERYLANNWTQMRVKLINRIKESYRKAPFFKEVFPIVEDCIMQDNQNLFHFLFNSIQKILDYLDIKTKLTVSSAIEINHDLKSQDKVLAICNALNTNNYINPIGGIQLYSNQAFQKNDINLFFLKSILNEYPQLGNNFVPGLSIIDVLMFNSPESLKTIFLNHYDLVSNER